MNSRQGHYGSAFVVCRTSFYVIILMRFKDASNKFSYFQDSPKIGQYPA
jgi:hypothetical protein